MYGYGFYGAGVVSLIAIIFAVIGAVLMMVLFLCKKNSGRFTGFLGWAYDFFNFNVLYLEAALKALYVFCCIFITVYGFGLFFVSGGFLIGLMTLTFGNVVLRLLFEFSIMFVKLANNVASINRKMPGEDPMDAPRKKVFATSFCPKCGKPFEEDEEICAGCGAKRK